MIIIRTFGTIVPIWTKAIPLSIQKYISDFTELDTISPARMVMQNVNLKSINCTSVDYWNFCSSNRCLSISLSPAKMVTQNVNLKSINCTSVDYWNFCSSNRCLSISLSSTRYWNFTNTPHLDLKFRQTPLLQSSMNILYLNIRKYF